MKTNNYPIVTILLALLTLCFSFYAALEISGSFFGKVRVVQLEAYGGIYIEHLANFELWRLLSSQLVHVKQAHMLYNVLSLLVIAYYIERKLGATRLFILWFFSGAIGTIFSTFFVPSPWNLGTGGSQAIFGLAAYCVLMHYRGIDTSRRLKFIIAFTMLPALTLDMLFAHYPKPGHVLSFLVGMAISHFFLKKYPGQLQYK